MTWIRDRSLSLVTIALFAACGSGQLLTGWAEYNQSRVEHGQAAISLLSYLRVGHPWEAALFENWESELRSPSPSMRRGEEGPPAR